MAQKKLPLINSAHGSDTRNIINELIKLFNQMGYTYNESLQKAHDVLNEAKQTNDMNKDVQEQIDRLIISDGESDAEVIQARGGLPLLKDRLDESDAQLAQTKNRTQITPDDFEGTDSEKIKQAIYKSVEDEVYTIDLTRVYDLTGQSIDIEEDTFWYEVTLRGGTIVKHDEGFIFYSSSGTKSHNSMQFENTHFYGKEGVDAILFNGDHFIRQNMTGCYFKYISLVHAETYIQSLRLFNNETTYHNTDFIRADNGFDLKVVGHRGETSRGVSHFINLVTSGVGVSFIDLQIDNSLFEGYTETFPIKIGTGYNLNINGVYFEANLGDIEIVNPHGTNLITGTIKNNIFNVIHGDIHIKFSNDTFVLTSLKIEGNTLTSRDGKSLMNKTLRTSDVMSNRATSSGRLTSLNQIMNENNSYNTIQVDKGFPSFEYEIPLNNANGSLNNYNDRQFLINISFNFQTSTVYRGHLTGIVSIDNHYDEGSIKSVLNLTILSERSTSGNTNGSLEHEPVFNYYFKETGSKVIPTNANKVTIVVEIPNANYHSTNRMTVKNINSILQSYIDNY